MPKSVQSYLNQAGNAYQNRSFEEAESYLLKALELDPGNAHVLHNLGALRDRQEDFDKAADYYRRALAAAPDDAVMRRGLASLLFDQGDHDESRQLYADLIQSNPNDIDAHFAYSRLTRYQPDDAMLAALRAAGNSIDQLQPDEQIKLCFTIGKAHQDLGEYGPAFRAFNAGNNLHYCRFPYDENANFALLNDVQQCFDAAFFESHAPVDLSNDAPIFVIGMPRSGSTLIEQILASHSEVSAAGEVRYLKQRIQEHLIKDKGTFANAIPHWTAPALRQTASDYLALLNRHSNGRVRVVDKMPGNYAFVGLIALLFPHAKIIHSVRHPMATLWSNYSTHFGDALHYTYQLDVLTRYFIKYREVMEHWRAVLPEDCICDIEYERLVSDPEGTLRSLFDYLELGWESSCLDFHATKRNVKTASVAQVRQPLYATAVDQWQNYREQLRPYAEQLESA